MKEDEFLKTLANSRITIDGTRGSAPLMMFHGSSVPFTRFDVNRSGSITTSVWGAGAHLTPHRHTAEYYGLEAFVKMDTRSNELFSVYKAEQTSEALDAFRSARSAARLMAKPIVMEFFVNIENPFVCAYQSSADTGGGITARQLGHDGIVLLNPAGYIDEIVAFSADQLIFANSIERPNQLKDMTIDTGGLTIHTIDPDFYLSPTT